MPNVDLWHDGEFWVTLRRWENDRVFRRYIDSLKKHGFRYDSSLKSWHTPYGDAFEEFVKEHDLDVDPQLVERARTLRRKTLSHDGVTARGDCWYDEQRGVVCFQIRYEDYEFRQLLKKAGAVWNKERKLWETGDAKVLDVLLRSGTSLHDRLQEIVRERTERLALSQAKRYEIDVPVPAGKALRPHQYVPIAYLLKAQRGMQASTVLIGDPMGSGKTATILGFCNYVAANEGLKVVVYYVRPSLAFSVEAEMREWLTFPAHIVRVTSKTDIAEIYSASKGPCVFLVPYSIAHHHNAALSALPIDVMIVDECQDIKHEKARRTRAIVGDGEEYQKISGRYNAFLSGTLTPKDPSEIFTVLKQYASEIYPGIVRAYKRGDVQGMAEMLRANVLVHRKKEEILTDLPPKERAMIFLEPTEQIRKHIAEEERVLECLDQIEMQTQLAHLELAFGADDAKAIEALTERIKGLSGQYLQTVAQRAKMRHTMGLAKVPQIIEFVQQIDESEKVVVFTWHRDVAERVAQAFGEEAVLYSGDVPQALREQAVHRFRDPNGARIFVGTMEAGGVGLNLQVARYVVMAEPHSVPGTLLQAEDRCHRIGSENKVLVYYVISGDTSSPDARILRNALMRMQMLERLMSTDTVAGHNVEELLRLEEVARIPQVPLAPSEVARWEALGRALAHAPLEPPPAHVLHGVQRVYTSDVIEYGRLVAAGERPPMEPTAYEAQLAQYVLTRPPLTQRSAEALRRLALRLGEPTLAAPTVALEQEEPALRL